MAASFEFTSLTIHQFINSAKFDFTFKTRELEKIQALQSDQHSREQVW